MIYFTSDLHLYHSNIISLCDNPFGSLEETNDLIISRLKDTLKPKDELYILGDVAMASNSEIINKANEVLKKLPGKKYLITGNHDYKTELYDCFTWIKPYHELKYKHRLFCLFHYPIEEWNKFFRDLYHLHGHIHKKNNEIDIKYRRYDVGVDANVFTPISIEDIIKKFENETNN